jgi:hypothetical protein
MELGMTQNQLIGCGMNMGIVQGKVKANKWLKPFDF